MFKPLKIPVEIFVWDENDCYKHFTPDGGYLFLKVHKNNPSLTVKRTPQIVKAHFSSGKGFIALPWPSR
jgi:hypothetical protein